MLSIKKLCFHTFHLRYRQQTISKQTRFDKPNDVATEQKKQKKIDDTIESVIDDKNPFNTFDDFWWEDDLFSEKDKKETVEVSKNILDEIKEICDNILRNIKPVDDRTVEELIDDDFIEHDERTQQQLEDDDYIELESDEKSSDVDIDLTSAWDPKETTVADPRKPIIKLSTDYNKKVKVTNKIKNKYKEIIKYRKIG